ncbi:MULTISPECIES: polysaccharide deacetylase family protein [unclassified Clostridium]|uniref:polysaccharide deacetylase family protein n=1 Tax=unclassified Clostridium TaxID=2614128 RepID=UPI00189B32BB|nr:MULTISPECIES: polysaccharide deacetylase family protein [unclassified Clostridium]MCR1949823.1 polysaccharide deacetylase [Clostridium sp. DSM 100503]
MRYKVKIFLAILVSAVILSFMFKIDMRSISVNSLIEESEVNENDVSNKKKVIYLTFDDGPSYTVTGKILDVLEEKEVKATFFVIGNQIQDREDVLKRMNDEGHSIGLHTFTHKYNCIYCNEDRFMKEMIDCRNEINRVVGVSPNIIRFPGGSYKHLNKNLLNRLHENNLKVYDWNLDNSDGLNPKQSKDALYRNAIKGSKDLKTINLLMHCTDMNKNTCEALTNIIDYYKDQGYEFKTINEDTPEMYFRIS